MTLARRYSTPAERHSDLERLRALWTEAIHLVRLSTPRTPEWNEARLLERHHAAEYLRELCEPPGSGEPGGG